MQSKRTAFCFIDIFWRSLRFLARVCSLNFEAARPGRAFISVGIDLRAPNFRILLIKNTQNQHTHIIEGTYHPGRAPIFLNIKITPKIPKKTSCLAHPSLEDVEPPLPEAERAIRDLKEVQRVQPGSFGVPPVL